MVQLARKSTPDATKRLYFTNSLLLANGPPGRRFSFIIKPLLLMNNPQKHPNHAESKAAGNAAEMTAQPGTSDTGASSHVDPLAANLKNANPASNQKGLLHPTRTDQSATAWLNQLPQQLQQWGSQAATQISRLSTTEKVVGGTLLVGLGWLTFRPKKNKKNKKKASAAEKAYAAMQADRPWGTTNRTKAKK